MAPKPSMRSGEALSGEDRAGAMALTRTPTELNSAAQDRVGSHLAHPVTTTPKKPVVVLRNRPGLRSSLCCHGASCRCRLGERGQPGAGPCRPGGTGRSGDRRRSRVCGWGDRRLSLGHLTVIDRGRSAAVVGTRIVSTLPPAMPRRRSCRRLPGGLSRAGTSRPGGCGGARRPGAHSLRSPLTTRRLPVSNVSPHTAPQRR